MSGEEKGPLEEADEGIEVEDQELKRTREETEKMTDSLLSEEGSAEFQAMVEADNEAELLNGEEEGRSRKRRRTPFDQLTPEQQDRRRETVRLKNLRKKERRRQATLSANSPAPTGEIPGPPNQSGTSAGQTQPNLAPWSPSSAVGCAYQQLDPSQHHDTQQLDWCLVGETQADNSQQPRLDTEKASDSIVENEGQTKQSRNCKRSEEAKERRKVKARERKKRRVACKRGRLQNDTNEERRPSHSDESRSEEIKKRQASTSKKGAKYSPTQSVFVELMSDPELMHSEMSLRRLEAVHSKVDAFLNEHKDVCNAILGGLKERVYSILVCHALKIMSSKDGSQIGVIQYPGHDFKILPASELVEFIDEKIDAKSSGGMWRILVKTGHIIVPSFCISGQNQKKEKLNRRRNRVRKFRKLCNDILVLSKFDESSSNSDGLLTLISDDLQKIKFHEDPKKSNDKGKAVVAKRIISQNVENVSTVSKKARIEEQIDCKSKKEHSDKDDSIPKNLEKDREVQYLGAAEVSNIILDTYSAIEKQSTVEAGKKDSNVLAEVSGTTREQPVSAHDKISEKTSGELINPKESAEEDPKVIARRLKNKLRNDRRKRGKLLNKSAQEIEGFNPAALSPSIVKAVCSLVLPSSSSARGTDTYQQSHQDICDQNPARLEKGAHYVCWFDTSTKAFSYRKLLKSSQAGDFTRHRPYHSFRNSPTDQEHSPVIQIDFERLPMSRTEQPARVTAQRLEEMRKTCVANTLPPATNELPPWNPIYANLYIMEVKENDQNENHQSSLVEIWKYPIKQTTKFSMRIRSG